MHSPHACTSTTLRAIGIVVCMLRSVLQIKDLPPRPVEYDGLLCLGGVPDGINEAAVKAKLLQFGVIESCAAPAGPIREYRVKFAEHEGALAADAFLAKAEPPKLGVCQYAFIAYRDYDPYNGRGW